MKSIHRDGIRTDIDLLEREIEILMNIDHPNIIEFDEIYMDDKYFHFITQFNRGKDLLDNMN